MSKKVALVLASGGARGIAHIGVIQELEEQGYEISSICGASIGAVIGGLYAAGKLNEYTDWITSLDRMDVFNLMDFGFRADGFMKGAKVFQHMGSWIEGMNIEDLQISFTCVATDIANKKEHVFESGDLSTAIRASVAIPGMLTPVEYSGALLYDGGVVNPIPINQIKRTENDLLIAVDLNANVDAKDRLPLEEEPIIEEKKTLPQSRVERLKARFQDAILPPQGSAKQSNQKLHQSYFAVMNGMFDMMQENISGSTIKNYPPDVLVEIPRDICSTFEFHRSKALIDLGRRSIRKALEKQQG